jgi:tetratricopeptide (TPR) repeat protein
VSDTDRAWSPYTSGEAASTALVPLGHEEEPSTELMVRADGALDGTYLAPRPGRSWRSGMRTMVLLGGSVAIGTGVAVGWFSIGAAALMAVGLATAQVVAQTLHQNRLGQDVMGGIAGGDLERALRAAERALEESPSGGMRTLAASNLASVLMQADRIMDGARVLDRWPPGILHIPLSTVLWLNNRAFAHVVGNDDVIRAGELLGEAERRLEKAGPRGFGGNHNYRKIASALAGTRAMERLATGQPKEAIANLDRSQELDEAIGVPFRVAERELCRAEALRRLGRKDEAALILVELRDQELTPRQLSRLSEIEAALA